MDHISKHLTNGAAGLDLANRHRVGEALNGKISMEASSSDKDGMLAWHRSTFVKRYQNRLQAAGIPPRYAGYTLKGIRASFDGDKREACNAACTLVKEGHVWQRDENRHSLLLAGSFGTGKTTLATATFKEMMYVRDNEGLWFKFYDFVRYIQAGYGDGTANRKLNRIKRVPILLLDDVGDIGRQARETESRCELLFEVLDCRNDNLFSTLFTTNLDEVGLVTQFGERTFQRILEMCALVRLEGRNFRLS